MTYDFIGFVWIAFLAVAVTAAWAQRTDYGSLTRRLILAGLLLRIVGSTARYEVFTRFYDSGGDAGLYYFAGLRYAGPLRSLDFSILFDQSLWWIGKWWGTQFVRFISGFVLAGIGPTFRGEFMVFSLFAFCGLLLFARAFREAFPQAAPHRYVGLVLLFPSLWFWPSSVGKEAVVLLGLGMVAAGYAGRAGRLRWLLLAAGVGLLLCIRPHLAAAAACAIGAAQWLAGSGRGRRGTPLRSVALAAIMVVVVVVSLQRLGLEEVDLEGVSEFMTHRAQMTARGGSSIESTPGGLAALPMAFVNILLRPFPWEAHHSLALFSSLEVMLLWFLVWRRRKHLAVALRGWPRSRFITFALVFSLLYIVMTGLSFRNLGIIARQRTLVFPFLFVLLEVPLSHRLGRRSAEAVPRRPPGSTAPAPGHRRLPPAPAASGASRAVAQPSAARGGRMTR